MMSSLQLLSIIWLFVNISTVVVAFKGNTNNKSLNQMNDILTSLQKNTLLAKKARQNNRMVQKISTNNALIALHDKNSNTNNRNMQEASDTNISSYQMEEYKKNENNNKNNKNNKEDEEEDIEIENIIDIIFDTTDTGDDIATSTVSPSITYEDNKNNKNNNNKNNKNNKNTDAPTLSPTYRTLSPSNIAPTPINATISNTTNTTNNDSISANSTTQQVFSTISSNNNTANNNIIVFFSILPKNINNFKPMSNILTSNHNNNESSSILNAIVSFTTKSLCYQLVDYENIIITTSEEYSNGITNACQEYNNQYRRIRERYSTTMQKQDNNNNNQYSIKQRTIQYSKTIFNNRQRQRRGLFEIYSESNNIVIPNENTTILQYDAPNSTKSSLTYIVEKKLIHHGAIETYYEIGVQYKILKLGKNTMLDADIIQEEAQAAIIRSIVEHNHNNITKKHNNDNNMLNYDIIKGISMVGNEISTFMTSSSTQSQSEQGFFTTIRVFGIFGFCITMFTFSLLIWTANHKNENIKDDDDNDNVLVHKRKKNKKQKSNNNDVLLINSQQGVDNMLEIGIMDDNSDDDDMKGSVTSENTSVKSDDLSLPSVPFDESGDSSTTEINNLNEKSISIEVV